MKKTLLALLCFGFIAVTTFAQTAQTVRGVVVDKDSRYPLVGVTVVVLESTDDKPKENTTTAPKQGAATDANGSYRIENVSAGRHTFRFSFVGYKDAVLANVVVNSGKELLLDVALEENAAEIKAVVVTATKYGEVRNEMATVSSKPFSIEETDRYAGSRGDPARMASAFAGVQGGDDSRNDVVVRGNSPAGVLWRFEGVDIFSANHFNSPGTTGSAQTILNNKWLANSDFFTGAFPAEYGNTTAAAFDLRMRSGNDEKYEFSGQFGFLGTEVLAEGPFSSTSKASWLASYRYSTLSIIGNLGINFGTDAIPRYQDAAFRLNFPLKGNASLAVFGFGGFSDVDILVSDKNQPITDLYAQNDRDQYFHSRLGVMGATYSKTFNARTFMKLTLMEQGEQTLSEDNLVFRHVGTDNLYHNDSITKSLRYDFHQTKTSLAGVVSHKLAARWLLKAGFNLDLYSMHFHDTIRKQENPYTTAGTTNPEYRKFLLRFDGDADHLLVQPYAQVRYQATPRFAATFGLHAQYFTLGNALSAAEPRVGARYELTNTSALTFGAGLHSQAQSTYLYYGRPRLRSDNDYTEYNNGMGFTKAVHIVGGYQKLLGKRTLFKAEAYYQSLFGIPIEAGRSSSF